MKTTLPRSIEFASKMFLTCSKHVTPVWSKSVPSECDSARELPGITHVINLAAGDTEFSRTDGAFVALL